MNGDDRYYNQSFAPEVCREGVLAGLTLLSGEGYALEPMDPLYSEEPPARHPVRLKAVPYFAWGNRGKNQMRVWMQEGGNA